MKAEVKLRRPSIVAIWLWINGVVMLALTAYIVFTQDAGMRDHLFLWLAGSTSVTQIVVGVLFDMHTMRYKSGRKAHPDHYF